MEFDRRVQIRWYRPGGGTPRFGSGYLVAPRLALTAAHVVGTDAPGPGSLTVSLPDTGPREFAGRVCWFRRDGTVDVALVEVAEEDWPVPASLSDPHTRPPQRWGHLIGTRRHPVAVVGFPRMQKDPAGHDRHDGEVAGVISPCTGSLARRYEVISTDPGIPPDQLPGRAPSAWAGISGGPVIAEARDGGLLCGVVSLDRLASGGTRLTATRTTELLADPDFRRIVAEHAGWEPLLEPAEPADLLEPAARERDLLSPAMLLRADAEAVRFRGRDGELLDLRSWCLDDPRPFSVRVLTGPGGQGKTRLARHLMDGLRAAGWVTGQLRPTLRDVPEDRLRSLVTALPSLLVIDYADTRPDLVRRVVDQLRTTRHRVRLLLLARADGGWRRDGIGETRTDELLAGAEVTALAPLAPAEGPAGARAEAFTDAVTDFALLLDRLPAIPGRPPAGWHSLAAALRPPPDLVRAAYDTVLTVQMAALTTLLQHGTAPVPDAPDDEGGPAAVLLRHEQRYWTRSARENGGRLDGLSPRTPKVAVAVATLCGAADREEAVATLRRGLDVPAHRAGDVAAWLRSLYPPGPDRYWGPLQPDRVGEYLACLVLFDPELRLPLPALVAGGSGDQQVQLFTVLVRAATAYHDNGRTAEPRRIERELLDALDGAEVDTEALLRLDLVMPYEKDRLDTLALRLAERRVTATAGGVRDDGPVRAVVEHGLALDRWGTRLGLAGRPEEAVRAQLDAAGVLRRAAEADRRYASLHVGALPGLSDALLAVGREAEALAVLDEADTELHRLADEGDADPDSWADLGWRLYRLEPRLRAAGREEAAIRALGRSVEFHRRLAGSSLGTDVLLANSVQALGAMLHRAGRLPEALRATEEAVERMRALARINPAGYERWLISALMNLSNMLRDAGRDAEEYAVLTQAVGLAGHRIRIGLAKESEEHLAAHLTLRLGLCEDEAGRAGAALDRLLQAREIWRRLAGARFEEYGVYHARCQRHVADLLMRAGRDEEALAAAAEGVEAWHRLEEAAPGAHGYELVTALSIHAGLLFWLAHDAAGALAATGEAVEICRGLTPTSAVVGSLRLVLGLQAQVLDALGRGPEAQVVRRWLADHPQE
ncbi:hypothetical protein IHE55_27695 [Streptomyces pactum]|uniref:Serine protease n=1 Tax=Streptomyces pactum TaxID=68249 RepID=A0ABS0NT19_9ACTN|nr:hypothetical protein [Streptomyces pactum]